MMMDWASEEKDSKIPPRQEEHSSKKYERVIQHSIAQCIFDARNSS
jgi:hypothetical protein